MKLSCLLKSNVFIHIHKMTLFLLALLWLGFGTTLLSFYFCSTILHLLIELHLSCKITFVLQVIIESATPPVIFSAVHLPPKLLKSSQLPICANMLANAFWFCCINPQFLQAHFHDLCVMEYLDIIAYKSNIESSNINNGNSSSTMVAPSIICDSKDALD